MLVLDAQMLHKPELVFFLEAEWNEFSFAKTYLSDCLNKLKQ